MTFYYCGIDPGDKPGIALITGKETVLTANNSKDAFDLLLSLTKLCPTKYIVGVESLHAIWGVSAAATFSLGARWGFWDGVLQYLGIVYGHIKTVDWQKNTVDMPVRPIVKGLPISDARKAKKLHKDTIKMESFRAATVAFPKVRFPSHDVTDAVNIARYLRLLHESDELYKLGTTECNADSI